MDVALLLGAFGAGSMVVALRIPGMLENLSDRTVMLAGGAALPVLLATMGGVIGWLGGLLQWLALLIGWALLGAAASAVLTPSARLLRRNSSEESRPAVFAAQFSLSHACYLVSYPVAGTLGAVLGLSTVAMVLAGLGLVGTVIAGGMWRPVTSTDVTRMHRGKRRRRLDAMTRRDSPASTRRTPAAVRLWGSCGPRGFCDGTSQADSSVR